ncbi:MAG: right-handed parallel beta-helix repeat-containing protein [Prevotellaceae bacterium]|nr:right-handed parallel beta-helix repeat-containing protein [Prevotellaceae bacterium]
MTSMHSLCSMCLRAVALFLVSGGLAVETAARSYFVAPAGDDAGNGTKDRPFATFGKAQQLAEPGDTVFFRQGLYRVKNDEIQYYNGRYATVFHITRSGKEGSPIVFTGYRDERAVFDMSEINPGDYRLTGILLSADYIVMRQLEIVGLRVLQKGHSQSECVRVLEASHCVLDDMSFHDGMAIGVYLLAGHDNLFVNCDAYNNYDYYSDNGYGGNTDGFGAHCTSVEHTGNVFRKCRAWWNSDDGFDLINCLAPVVIEDCVAFYNGFRTGTLRPAGDGTGFKAGGYGMKPRAGMVRDVVEAPRHVVRRCIAYRNKNKGIYANHHLGGVEFTDNVSISNPRNYTMLCRKSVDEAVDVPGYGHILRNNISVTPIGKGKHYTDVDMEKCVMENNYTEEDIPVVDGKPLFDINAFVPEDYIQIPNKK